MGVRYEDEDGNEISPDQLDQYEEVPSYEEKPTEGFWERTADKTIANLVEKYGNLVGGGEALGADFLTNPDINIFSGETWGVMPKTSPRDIISALRLPEGLGLDAERGLDRKKRNDEFADAIRNSGQFENNTTGKIGNLASGAIADTANMATAFINPYAFAAEQGLGTLGREYADLKDRGYDFETAASTAGERGAFDAANNWLFAPMDRIAGSGVLTSGRLNPLKYLKGDGYLKSIPKVAANLAAINAGTDLNRQITDETMLDDKNFSDLDMTEMLKKIGSKTVEDLPQTIAQAMVMGGVNKVVGRNSKQAEIDPMADGPLGDLQDINPAPELLGLPEPQLKLPAPTNDNIPALRAPDGLPTDVPPLDIGRPVTGLDAQALSEDIFNQNALRDYQKSDFTNQVDQLTKGRSISPEQAVQVEQLLSERGTASSDLVDQQGQPITQSDKALLADIERVLSPDKPLTSRELRSSMDLLNQDPTNAAESVRVIAPEVYKSVREKFSADAFLPQESNLSKSLIDSADPAIPYEVVNEMPTLKEEFAKPELVKTKIEEPTTGEKTFPDSIDQKLKKAQEVELQNPPEKLSSVGEDPTAKKGPLNPNPESGALNLKPVADFATRVKDKFVDIVRAPEDLTKIYKDLEKEGINLGDKKIGTRELDFLEKKLSGRIFNKDRGQASHLVKAIHNGIILPRQLAIEGEQVGVPNVKKAYDSMHDRMNYESLTANEYMDNIKPLMDLTDTVKLSEFIQKVQIQSHEAAKKGQKLVVSDEAMRGQGLGDAEIAAYKAGRASADKMFDSLRDTALEQAVHEWEAENPGRENVDALNKRLSEIKSLYAGKKVANYWPIHRFGDYAVWAEKKGPDGKVTENFYNLHENISDRNEAVKNLVRRGFSPEEINTYTVKIPQDASASYASMPTELRLELDSVLGKSGAPKGFKAHMLPRKMVPGAQLDPQRVMAEYLTGAISYSAKMKFNKAIAGEVNAIDESTHPELKRKAQEWVKGIDDNSGEYAPLRTWLAHKHLGFLNPAAAAFNATQPLTSTYPELYHMGVKNPMATLMKSYGKADSFLRNPEKFMKKDPALGEVLTLAQKSGIIDDSQMRDLYGLSTKGTVRGNVKTFSDYSMALNSIVEKRNRASAFIAAYENAPKGVDAFAHARDFVTKTQFGYTKGERPAIGKGGVKAALYQFRTFGHNYMSNLKNVSTELFESMNKARIEQNPAKKAEYNAQAKRAIGTIARYSGGIGAIGGAKAVPFYVLAKTAFQLFSGVDPEKEGRKVAGDGLMDFFLYGGLGTMPGGVGMSSSLMTPEMQLIDNPSNLSNFGDAAFKYVGGAAYGQVTDVVRAGKALAMTGSIPRALEEVMPRTPKGIMVGARWAADGSAKNLKGQTVMEDPTALEVTQRMAGFMPSRYSKELRKESDYYNQRLEDSDKAAGWTRKIALAKEARDFRRVADLTRQAKENGVTVKASAVNKIIKDNADAYRRRENSLRKSSRGKISR